MNEIVKVYVDEMYHVPSRAGSQTALADITRRCSLHCSVRFLYPHKDVFILFIFFVLRSK